MEENMELALLLVNFMKKNGHDGAASGSGG